MRYVIDLGFVLPKVEIRGKYEVTGNVLLFPVRSKGDFWAVFRKRNKRQNFVFVLFLFLVSSGRRRRSENMGQRDAEQGQGQDNEGRTDERRFQASEESFQGARYNQSREHHRGGHKSVFEQQLGGNYSGNETGGAAEHRQTLQDLPERSFSPASFETLAA